MKELEIIDKAIKKFRAVTGIEVEYIPQSGRRRLADGIITIVASSRIILNVEIKNEIRQSHLPYLLEKKKIEKDKFIVVCRYIPMPVKNILKEEKVNYLETAGNCYIQVKNFLIYINDQKVTKERETGKSRIWNTAGLKFVFAIFHNPDLLNQPYRTIANKASVGLGTVGTLMEDFQKEGFVKQGKKDDQSILFLERRDELINKWATIYNTVLRPKQLVGRFRVASNTTLRDEKLPDGILWAGEMKLGAKLTKFLKPEKIQLYISLQKTEAMKLLKIVPDANGNIELLNIFWNNEIASAEQKKTQTVPPLIAYADLLSSHDSRNYETAERIKANTLKDKIKIEPDIAEMLSIAQKVFESFNIDFFLVGVVARDIQFSASPELASLRKTNDVDMAIMINNEEQFYEIKKALLTTGYFTEHETEPIKLFYKHAIEFDLLPFGEIENDDYEIRIHKPRLFIMDMPGFREASFYKEVVIVSDDFKLNVCSLEGLILLKLFAYYDKPDRSKDISDIDHVIKAYFDLFSDEIYKNDMDIMDLYDTANPKYLSLVAARIIGRKMKLILSDNKTLVDRVESILKKRPTEEWNAIADGFSN